MSIKGILRSITLAVAISAGCLWGLAKNEVIPAGWDILTTQAHAQAFDYAAALTSLRAMQEDLGRMIVKLERLRDGVIHDDEGNITLSAGQTSNISTQYNNARTRVRARAQALVALP